VANEKRLVSHQKKKKKGKYEMVKLSVLKIDCLREYTDSNNNIKLNK